MSAALAVLMGLMLMTPNQADAPRQDWTHPFDLSDGAFGTDAPVPQDLILARAESLGVTGLLLDGPRRTAPGAAVPLLGAYVRTLRDDLVLRVEDATLLVWEAGSGRLRSRPAFPSAKSPADDAPPEGFDPGEGRVASAFAVAAGAGEESWGPGRYRMWLVLAGHVSNPVTLTVTGGGDVAEDPVPPPGESPVLEAAGPGGVDLVFPPGAPRGAGTVFMVYQRRGGRSLRVWQEHGAAGSRPGRIRLPLPGDVTAGWLFTVSDGALAGPLVLSEP